MKINYQFANESVEIDVAEEWGSILIDLERQEYNANHKETRRHVPLYLHDGDEDADFDSPYLEDKTADVAAGAFRNIDSDRLWAAMEELEPAQRELVTEVYLRGVMAADIARRDGVSKAAISRRLDRALKKLRKILS